MDDQAKPVISYDDFCKLDLRVAKITAVSDHPNADKLLILEIDLGTEQRRIIAGLKEHCPPESLLGKNIVVVTNLQPRKMRGLESNAMLLAASYMDGDERKVVVITPDAQIPPGAEVS